MGWWKREGGGGIDESHMIPLNAQNRVNGCLR